MIAAGKMAPAGRAKIEAARRDGSWTALAAIEALAANPKAPEYFAAFPRSAKRGLLKWIANAKTPQTRAKRIGETARLAADNLRANQWRK